MEPFKRFVYRNHKIMRHVSYTIKPEVQDPYPVISIYRHI